MRPATLSRISSNVGINTYMAGKYIARLIKADLIVERVSPERYPRVRFLEITEKGKKFVSLYLSIQQIFPI